MKRSKSKTAAVVLFFAAIAFALGGAALLVFAMENDFDSLIMHFEFNSKFALGALGVALGALALAIAGFFTTSKKLSFEGDNKCSFLGTFISILAGLMCLLYFVLNVKKGLPETKRGLVLAGLTFVVLSSFFFFLKAFGAFAKKSAVALTGLLPALMSAFLLFNLYFNMTEPLNAPLKIYQTAMLVSFMLYFTAEAGVAIGHPKMGRKYVFAGIAATAAGGMVALSRLAARILDVDVFGYDIVASAFHVIIWLYIVISFAEKLFAAREIAEETAFFDSEADEDGAESEDEDAEDAAEEAEEAVEEEIDEVKNAVEETEKTVDEAIDKAENTVEEAEEAVEEAEEAVDESIDKTEGSADDIFEKVKAEAEKLTAEAAEKDE